MTNKIQISHSINLPEDAEIISDNMRIAEAFNKYFPSITTELDLTEHEANLSVSENITDPIDKAVQTQSQHKKTKQRWATQNLFEFGEIEAEDVSKQLERVNSK